MDLAGHLDFEALGQEIGAIVFDWNGTVVDDAERSLVATNAVLAELGCDLLDQALFRARFRLPMSNFFSGVGVRSTDLGIAERRWNQLLGRDGIRAQPGITDLLSTAGELGIATGVVSAASELAVRADAEYLGLENLFGFVVGSAADKAAVLRQIAAQTDGPLLYVGDTEYDILAALAAGAIAVGFGGGYRTRLALAEAGAVAVIDDFTELRDAFLRCPGGDGLSRNLSRALAPAGTA